MATQPPGRHLLDNALGFAAGARHAISMPGRHVDELVLQNLGNAIELSLKSVLQAHGWNDDRCRREIRHDLRKALMSTEDLGFRSGDPALAPFVALLSPFHQNHRMAVLAARTSQATFYERGVAVTEQLLRDIALWLPRPLEGEE